ncbi:alpha/beta hydrolase fold-3 domain-containing protein [Hypoxylon sp. FL0890]|nr:alpha/beta hydrolase fold-3 domain-containing protein [Hypoxylon sp. FL0890]
MATLNSYPLWSHQPFKLMFILAYVGILVVRLPFWIISAAIPSLRPHPKWTAKQTFMVHITYAVLDIESRIGITEPLSLEKEEDGDRFQVIRPSPEDVYKGPLASDIKPDVIGGAWLLQAPVGDLASKLVVLHLHGGAFVKGNGRTDYCGSLAKRLVKQSGADFVFSVQYRLSGYSGLNPFPAALQDALTGYLFLLNDLKIQAHQIVISGDSAGGNLIIGLLRYIEEFGAELNIPAPRCAALLSPWVALLDHDIAGNPNRGSDYLPASFLNWGARTYAGHLPDATSNPYITPLGNPFATTVPILINTGTAEILFDSHLRWADEMRRIKDNVVELHQEYAACHDTFLIGEWLGFEDSAGNVAEKIGAFIRRY